MSSNLKRLARSLLNRLVPSRSGGVSSHELDEVWSRIEAMDFGIHEQLREVRATLRRELAELRLENDSLYRRLEGGFDAAKESTEASMSDS